MVERIDDTESPEDSDMETSGTGTPEHFDGRPAPGHPEPSPPAAPESGLPWARPKLTRPERVLLVAFTALLVLAVAAVIVVLGRVAGTPVSTSPATSVPGAPAHAASLAKSVDPALVDITAPDTYQMVESLGTGIVLTSGGLVVTNNHVIEGATSVTARDVGNGQTYNVKIVGYDRSQDIALLQLIGASRLATARFGSSSKVAVGDGVVAVGNAEGAGGTPTYAGGSVTGLEQTISAADEMTGTTEELAGLIETNADVVPGDSGGALVNTSARVVGMVTAGSEGFVFEGNSAQGFAIPSDTVRSVVGTIAAGQSSSTVHVGPTAFLGVEVEPPAYGAAGAEIVAVLPDTPASHAGLALGDTITGIGGAQVSSPDSLTQLLESEKPGNSVQLRYVDASGVQHTTIVRLSSGPPQ